MCHTSRKQNGVHLAIKHNSSTAYLLGNAVNHGIKRKAAWCLPQRCASLWQECRWYPNGQQVPPTGNTFLQFFGSVTPGVTKVYQLPGRQGVPARSGETETVEGHWARPPHGRGGGLLQKHLHPEVTDNQIEVFVMHGSFGLQGTTLSIRRAMARWFKACQMVILWASEANPVMRAHRQLVHHARIGYKGQPGSMAASSWAYQTT